MRTTTAQQQPPLALRLAGLAAGFVAVTILLVCFVLASRNSLRMRLDGWPTHTAHRQRTQGLPTQTANTIKPSPVAITPHTANTTPHALLLEAPIAASSSTPPVVQATALPRPVEGLATVLVTDGVAPSVGITLKWVAIRGAAIAARGRTTTDTAGVARVPAGEGYYVRYWTPAASEEDALMGEAEIAVGGVGEIHYVPPAGPAQLGFATLLVRDSSLNPCADFRVAWKVISAGGGTIRHGFARTDAAGLVRIAAQDEHWCRFWLPAHSEQTTPLGDAEVRSGKAGQLLVSEPNATTE